MARQVELRPITNEEGNRLLRIVRRSSRLGGDLAAGADGAALRPRPWTSPRSPRSTFTGPDRVRDVIHNFNLDGFDALYPRYAGGRPPTFTLAQRQRDQADRAVAPGRP